MDNQKALQNTFQTTKFKVEENSRTFQGLAQKFKDFSRKNGIHGLFKTVRTLNLQAVICRSHGGLSAKEKE